MDSVKIELARLTSALPTMEMFQRRMLSVSTKFHHTIGTTRLQDHFGIAGVYTWTQPTMDTLHLTVQRTFHVVFPLDLPQDLCEVISSFLHQDTLMTLMFTYTSAFTPPTVSLSHFHSNLYVNPTTVIQLHNRQYKEIWSPAVTMESDILCLLVAVLPLLKN